MIETVIIGSGNVASSLAAALAQAGNPPKQIYARNQQAAAQIASAVGCDYTSSADKLAPADIYLVAVADKAIATVCSKLEFGNAIVAHTAGSVSINKLPGNVRHKAVFYPLQTFTKGRDMDFGKIPVLIEAQDKHILEQLRQFASVITSDVREVESGQRALIHIAAVFACNFTNYMYTVADNLVTEAGEDFSILKPLILETAEKAVDSESPDKVQTGPAVRNDFQTKSLHCEMLVEKPGLKNIYINLSNNIWETSKKISRK